MKRQGRLILLLWLAWLAPSLCAQTPLPVHVLAEDGPFRDSFIQALDDAATPSITRVSDPTQAELLIAIGDQVFRRAQKLDKPLLGVYVSRSAVTLADRKSTRLNSSHDQISYAVFCLKKKSVQCCDVSAVSTKLQ